MTILLGTSSQYATRIISMLVKEFEDANPNVARLGYLDTYMHGLSRLEAGTSYCKYSKQPIPIGVSSLLDLKDDTTRSKILHNLSDGKFQVATIFLFPLFFLSSGHGVMYVADNGCGFGSPPESSASAQTV